MSHKLDDDELGGDTASWPQDMSSGYWYFTWLHATLLRPSRGQFDVRAYGERLPGLPYS